MTVIDTPALAAPALDAHPTVLDAFEVGDWIRIRGEIDMVFHVHRFDVFEDQPDEVLVFGGKRKKDEWIDAAWRSFHVSRIVEVFKIRHTPTGGVVVIR